MFEMLKKLLDGQNQFASGGLLLMIVGAISVWLRSIPLRVWYWLEHQFTMTLTVKDEDAAFSWVKQWFLEQEFLKKVRRVDVDTTLQGETLALIPAPGRHWFWREGRPFWVWFTRSDESKGYYSQRRTESLTFQTIGRDQRFLRAFVAEVVDCHKRKTRRTSQLYVYNDGWEQVVAYSPRSLESVILKAGEKERLIDDVERFLASKKRYRELGVPYHRGFLFYGPPGTGKTSLVSGLAARFAMPVYCINLTEFTDRNLKSAVSDVPKYSLILFEDIDCMKTGTVAPRNGDKSSASTPAGEPGQKNDSDKFGVTLSGLLNVLDGFNAPDAVLFAMTTNKVEALDAALLRPGRIDYQLFMGRPTESQKIELYRRFFPESSWLEAKEFVESHAATQTMAEVQGLLLALGQAEDQPEGTNQLTEECPLIAVR